MIRVLCFLSLVACLTSCGTAGFHKEWRAVKPGADGLSGAWEGTWLSESNGHSGKLKAVIGEGQGTQASPVRYYATWAGLLSGGFRTEHRFTKQGQGHVFSGSQSLGKYGDFTVKGSVKDGHLHANYEAAGDHGIFRMTRLSKP
jgi:hypothetical protein